MPRSNKRQQSKQQRKHSTRKQQKKQYSKNRQNKRKSQKKRQTRSRRRTMRGGSTNPIVSGSTPTPGQQSNNTLLTGKNRILGTVSRLKNLFNRNPKPATPSGGPEPNPVTPPAKTQSWLDGVFNKFLPKKKPAEEPQPQVQVQPQVGQQQGM